MSWYGQKNFNQIQGINGRYTIAQIGCFITGFCNLLKKFGKDVDPASLNRVFVQRGMYTDIDDGVRDDVGWATITGYDGQVQVTATGGAGWPPNNNAIVKFAYKSPKTGAPMTHFCLVADAANKTIVDSWDGVIRTPGYYGEPVAWATYADITPQPVVIAQAPSSPKSNATTGQVVKLEKGDTISAIALRYGFTASEVLEHNGLNWDDARNLPVGYELRLPVAAAPPPATDGYKIEVLPELKHMHVSRQGGAEKWGFGNVKEWKDFVSNGHIAENTNVDIVAIANVIIGKDVAAYYMDALALGDYRTTGRPANTIGFNWKDLSDGSYVAPEPAPVVVAEPKPEPKPEPAPAPLPTKVTEIDPETINNRPNQYKTTYKAWAKPIAFLVLNDGYAVEQDGRRANKTIHKNQVVSIGGSFIKGQILYARPAAAAQAGLWWGIPMDNLISEDAVFNTHVPLPEKVAMRYVLTYREKIVVALSRLTALVTKLTAKK